MEDQKLPEELEKYADLEVGDILRRTRLHYGQSLDDIERALRIRESQIDAIEKGDVEKLPGRVYAIGFVRTYAEYLGLDGDKIVHLFKAQYMDTNMARHQLSFPVPASETRTPPIWLILVSIAVAIMILVAWGIKNTPQRKAVEDIQDVPHEITERIEADVLPAPIVEQVEEASIMAREAADIEQPKGIILNLLDKSWVEIRDQNGKAIVSDVLNQGDQYFVPDNPGLTMSLGNAGAVEILVDGRALKPLGKEGDVQRDIPLDTTYLKTLEFVPVDEETISKPLQEEFESSEEQDANALQDE